WGVGARHRPCVPPGTSRIKPRAPPRVARCDRGCQSPGVTVRFARLDPLPHQRRSLLPLRGPDTTRFVQGIVSTNVEGLPPDRAVAAGRLTVKGKLISEVVVLPAGGEDLDLLVPAGEVAEVAELLDKHVIMDEVEVRPPEETSVVVMWTDDGSAASVEVDRARARTFVARHPAPSLLL